MNVHHSQHLTSCQVTTSNLLTITCNALTLNRNVCLQSVEYVLPGKYQFDRKYNALLLQMTLFVAIESLDFSK